MNPITVFKDINRRLEVEDHLAGVKEQARVDAARFAQAAVSRTDATRKFEMERMLDAENADSRYALEELQQSGLNERKQWELEAEAAKAAAAAKATGVNTHFDNAMALPDEASATTYLNANGQGDMVPVMAARFAARGKEQKRAAVAQALKSAGTVAEMNAVLARPETKEFLNDPEIAPLLAAAQAGATEADRRYNTVESRRAQANARAQAGADRTAAKTGKPVVLSAAQERNLVNDLTQAKLAVRYAADEEERALLQERVDQLEDLKTRAKRTGTGAGSSAFSPEVLAELGKIFDPNAGKKK